MACPMATGFLAASLRDAFLSTFGFGSSKVISVSSEGAAC
jgi:hypothetical protein